MPKILWVSDPPWRATGYSRIIENLIKFSSLDIVCVGSTHFGSPILYAHPDWLNNDELSIPPVKVYGRGAHKACADVLPRIIKKEKPDYVVTLWDIGLQRNFIKVMKSFPKVKWYPYVPFDSLITLDWQADVLRHADKVITMSKYGQRKLSGELGLDVSCIPLGVDTDLYKPMNVDGFKKGTGLKNKFIVVSVGVNQRRKFWGKLLEGFSLFAKTRRDVTFLMHTDISTNEWDSYDILSYVKKYKLENKQSFTDPQKNVYWRNDISETDMVRLYNAADVGLYAGAEGFGLPILEEQACGKPIVVGNQTTAEELVGNHGVRVPIDGIYFGKSGIEFGMPSAKAIAEGLELYYKDEGQRKRDGKKARKHAIDNYKWQDIVTLWEELLT